MPAWRPVNAAGCLLAAFAGRSQRREFTRLLDAVSGKE